MKTVQDFKTAAKEKNITRWNIHDCSICGYVCGYIIQGDQVYYDSGCDCIGRENVQPRSWHDIVEHYNMQTSEKYIKEMNAFWGFST